MTVLGFFLAALFFAIAGFMYKKAEALKDKLHEAEKKLARESSPEEQANHFKVLSEELLEQQSAKSSKAIDDVLQPVREQVGAFQTKIEEYVKESRETRTVLDEKFKNLDVNVKNLGDEARQLTDALRGNPKVRGNWGEVLLKKALELAGLQEGPNFELQRSFEIEGRRFIPDAVVKLPEDRQVIIDSKVSLIAYDDYVNANDEQEQEQAGKRFATDVEKQVDEVCKYLHRPEINTPGFALMFTPIEPAWVLLNHIKPQLLLDSYKKGVLIVGPTTLLATLKVVEQMWRNERKVRSIKEIIDRAGMLREAVERLLDRLENSARHLDRATREISAIETSIRGRQGVVAHARKLEEYGIKGKDALPEVDEETGVSLATSDQAESQEQQRKEDEKITN